MKSTLGYMVYQCQIIDFLNKFCGFTRGEADLVRRHFSKKLGTETDIPVIKNGGFLLTKDKNGTMVPMNDHNIAGFINTMKKDYGLSEEESEKIIVSFIKVIEDASDYLLSKNHSDPYSWIGYICGYLRYYYPLEFITSALNIFADNEEKSVAIIKYAKKVGIRISPIKFRHSVAEYNFDKENNEIFKGIASIKYLNSIIADELYTLRNNHYEQFTDLLLDIREYTTCDSRQIEILIKLDFFSEFGDVATLLEQYRIYSLCHSNKKFKKQFKKDFVAQLGISEQDIRNIAGKETAKMFTNVPAKPLLRLATANTSAPKRLISQRIADQVEYLGYVDIIGEEYSSIAAVLDIDTKYAPKVTLYSLKNGTNLLCKLDKRAYKACKIEKGDLIKIYSTQHKPKMRRNEDGKFDPVPGEFELWITKYQKVTNI